ncbi:MAG: HD domain-containing phosphohydrolase [Pseudomonadota bacterium]
MLENSKDWPNNFDFETDATCQSVFKPFIKTQMNALKALDAARPEDITYVFHEHAERVANAIKKACLHLGLSEMVANNMYWATLPHDIGKAALPPEIWDTEEKPSDELKAQRRTHVLLGVQIVEERFGDLEHPFKDLMMDIMKHHHEQIDGQGELGIPGDQLSSPVRLAAIVEAFDGWSIPRPHFGDRDISPAGVLKRMREEKLHMFDAELFEAFEMIMLEKTS